MNRKRRIPSFYRFASAFLFLLSFAGCASRNAGAIGTGTYYIDEVRASVVTENHRLIVEYGADKHENTFSIVSSDSRFAGREPVVGVYDLGEFSPRNREDDGWQESQRALMEEIDKKAGCLPSDIRRGYFLMGEKFHGQEARRWIEEMQKEGGRKLSVLDINAGNELGGGDTHVFRMMYSEGGDFIYGDQLVQGVLFDTGEAGDPGACRWDVLIVLPEERYVWYDDKRLLRWAVTPVAYALDVVTFPVQLALGLSLYYGAGLPGGSSN